MIRSLNKRYYNSTIVFQTRFLTNAPGESGITQLATPTIKYPPQGGGGDGGFHNVYGYVS